MGHLGFQLQLERERLKRNGPATPVPPLRKSEKGGPRYTRGNRNYARELEARALNDERRKSYEAERKKHAEDRLKLIQGAHETGSPVCVKIQHVSGNQAYQTACSKTLANVVYSIYLHEVTCADCLVLLDWSFGEGEWIEIEDQVIPASYWNTKPDSYGSRWDPAAGEYVPATVEWYQQNVLSSDLRTNRARDFPERAEEFTYARKRR